MRFLVKIIIISMMCSCTAHTNKEQKLSDSICVIFNREIIETPIPIPIEKFRQKNNYLKAQDTIVLSKNEYQMIDSFMKSNYNLENIDCRLYLKAGPRELCFPDQFGKDSLLDKLCYLVRCRCGYYNYFTPEDVKLDALVRKYGFPKSYKYKLLNDSFYNGMYPIKRKGSIKVLFVHE